MIKKIKKVVKKNQLIYRVYKYIQKLIADIIKNRQLKRHRNNKFPNRKYVFNSDRYNIDFLKDKYVDKLPYQKAEKIIYCFWTGDNELTPNRIEALKLIRENSGVKVQLITKENLDEYILEEHPLHPAYKFLSAVHKSDYLRCYFMHYYGGGYTDIKRTYNDWNELFDKLNNSEDKIALGYREKTQYDVGKVVNFIEPSKGVRNINKDIDKHYYKLIGNGAYIFKPYTSLTKSWLEEVERRLDIVYKDLQENPGNIWGDNEGYPIPWTGVAGQITGALFLKYHQKLIIDDRIMPSFENYK